VFWQHHVTHRPNIRPRSGSATGLNAGSHPGGTFIDGANLIELELISGRWRLDACGSRSPLCVRLTDMTEKLAPSAKPVVAMLATPANTALSSNAPAICFEPFPNRRMISLRALDVNVFNAS